MHRKIKPEMVGHKLGEFVATRTKRFICMFREAIMISSTTVPTAAI